MLPHYHSWAWAMSDSSGGSGWARCTAHTHGLSRTGIARLASNFSSSSSMVALSAACPAASFSGIHLAGQRPERQHLTESQSQDGACLKLLVQALHCSSIC